LLVSELTAVFSAYLGFSIADQCMLVEAALLHDIGKIQIQRQLLRKPAGLAPEEMRTMRTHPEIGHLLLAAEGGHNAETLTVVRQHHERLDGSGYPDGSLASHIAEPVRLVTLCDIYAAMTEPRPYGTALQGPEALLTMAMRRTRIDLRLMKHFALMVTTLLFPVFH
jgi:HD-GYP domain-containing protein (c-di-GMP phosphodiesterase class II)